MATLTKFPLGGFFGFLFKSKRHRFVQSPRAREFANQVYKKTGGPTPEAKRLYAAYRASQNQR